MHFRLRNNVVQIIRVTYDPQTKRGKNAIVGRLNKANPVITDELKKGCTEGELSEITQWIQNAQRKHSIQNEHAALTAAEQLQATAAWMAAQTDQAHAQKVYDQIRTAWLKVRQQAASAGLITRPAANATAAASAPTAMASTSVKQMAKSK